MKGIVMARKKSRGSISGYFRQLFTDHPGLLSETTNVAILARYRADHGLAEDAELPDSIKNNLANMKSVMRKKLRKGGKAAPKAARGSAGRLEQLEELIDDCLTLARTIDREGLDAVINQLRRARNEVVWKIGQ